MMDARNEQSTIVKTEDSKEYFAQRELKKGAVGWLLLVGLGVAYVISGGGEVGHQEPAYPEPAG